MAQLTRLSNLAVDRCFLPDDLSNIIPSLVLAGLQNLWHLCWSLQVIGQVTTKHHFNFLVGYIRMSISELLNGDLVIPCSLQT